jgi:uncharacterized protein (TIGR04255 family)
MATPRTLTRPPITEALVDLRASVSQPQEVFEEFARELADEFPTREEKRGMKAELRVENGKLIPPVAEDLGFQGLKVANRDGTLLVQVGPEGFTVNNLKSYVGGERLLLESLALWSRYQSRLKPTSVTRIALRYINQLELPFREGDEFDRFLTAAPELPDGSPQQVSSFLGRTVVQDRETSATAVVTQRLDAIPGEGGVRPRILIDVDVFRIGDFSTSADELRGVLERLRVLKNNIFFSLLKDAAVDYYI